MACAEPVLLSQTDKRVGIEGLFKFDPGATYLDRLKALAQMNQGPLRPSLPDVHASPRKVLGPVASTTAGLDSKTQHGSGQSERPNPGRYTKGGNSQGSSISRPQAQSDPSSHRDWLHPSGAETSRSRVKSHPAQLQELFSRGAQTARGGLENVSEEDNKFSKRVKKMKALTLIKRLLGKDGGGRGALLAPIASMRREMQKPVEVPTVPLTKAQLHRPSLLNILKGGGTEAETLGQPSPLVLARASGETAVQDEVSTINSQVQKLRQTYDHLKHAELKKEEAISQLSKVLNDLEAEEEAEAASKQLEATLRASTSISNQRQRCSTINSTPQDRPSTQGQQSSSRVDLAGRKRGELELGGQVEALVKRPSLASVPSLMSFRAKAEAPTMENMTQRAELEAFQTRALQHYLCRLEAQRGEGRIRQDELQEQISKVEAEMEALQAKVAEACKQETRAQARSVEFGKQIVELRESRAIVQANRKKTEGTNAQLKEYVQNREEARNRMLTDLQEEKLNAAKEVLRKRAETSAMEPLVELSGKTPATPGDVNVVEVTKRFLKVEKATKELLRDREAAEERREQLERELASLRLWRQEAKLEGGDLSNRRLLDRELEEKRVTALRHMEKAMRKTEDALALIAPVNMGLACISARLDSLPVDCAVAAAEGDGDREATNQEGRHPVLQRLEMLDQRLTKAMEAIQRADPEEGVAVASESSRDVRHKGVSKLGRTATETREGTEGQQQSTSALLGTASFWNEVLAKGPVPPPPLNNCRVRPQREGEGPGTAATPETWTELQAEHARSGSEARSRRNTVLERARCKSTPGAKDLEAGKQRKLGKFTTKWKVLSAETGGNSPGSGTSPLSARAASKSFSRGPTAASPQEIGADTPVANSTCDI